MIDLPPMNYEQTVLAIVECGISRDKIAINYVEDLQLDVVSIEGLGTPLSLDALTCVYRSTVPLGYDVQFAEEAQGQAFWRMAFEQGQRKARAEGHEWLGQRGLLDDMPTYQPGDSLPTFLEAVERHCSIEPRSALEALEGDLVTTRSDFTATIIGDPDRAAAFTCLMNVLAASGLAEGGIRFGFIGNVAEPSVRDER